jgi:hypothetical protein
MADAASDTTGIVAAAALQPSLPHHVFKECGNLLKF